MKKKMKNKTKIAMIKLKKKIIQLVLTQKGC